MDENIKYVNFCYHSNMSFLSMNFYSRIFALTRRSVHIFRAQLQALKITSEWLLDQRSSGKFGRLKAFISVFQYFDTHTFWTVLARTRLRVPSLIRHTQYTPSQPPADHSLPFRAELKHEGSSGSQCAMMVCASTTLNVVDCTCILR